VARPELTEATRPSLSRALPISSLALAALLGQHRSIHVATVGPVCLPRSSCTLTFRYPKQNHIPSPRHRSSHMAVQKSTSTAGDCLCCQQRSSSCHSLLFCFGSLVTRACTLAKTESVSPHVAGVASPQRLPTTLTQALLRNHRSRPLTETRLDHHPFFLNLKHRVRS
jgi:hypothetical protein